MRWLSEPGRRPLSAARLLAAGHSGRLSLVAPLLSLVPCPAAACARASSRSRRGSPALSQPEETQVITLVRGDSRLPFPSCCALCLCLSLSSPACSATHVGVRCRHDRASARRPA
jgi:hypothetical protein